MVVVPVTCTHALSLLSVFAACFVPHDFLCCCHVPTPTEARETDRQRAGFWGSEQPNGSTFPNFVGWSIRMISLLQTSDVCLITFRRAKARFFFAAVKLRSGIQPLQALFRACLSRSSPLA